MEHEPTGEHWESDESKKDKPAEEGPSEQFRHFQEHHLEPAEAAQLSSHLIERARQRTTERIEQLRNFTPSGDVIKDTNRFLEITGRGYFADETTTPEHVRAYFQIIRPIIEERLDPLARTYADIKPEYPDYEDKLTFFRDLPSEELRVIDAILGQEHQPIVENNENATAIHIPESIPRSQETYWDNDYKFSQEEQVLRDFSPSGDLYKDALNFLFTTDFELVDHTEFNQLLRNKSLAPKEFLDRMRVHAQEAVDKPFNIDPNDPYYEQKLRYFRTIPELQIETIDKILATKNPEIQEPGEEPI